MKYKVIPIQFSKVGKKHYYIINNFTLEYQDFVVAETTRGLELGMVSGSVKELTQSELTPDINPILRKATKDDLITYDDNKRKAVIALEKCKEEVEKVGLAMKLLSAEFTLDGSKVIFSYTAEGRVDFRQLLIELTKRFRKRIELRQVGERDGAKELGGIGFCGREICCSKHLTSFDTISVKMAKNQNLSLNPQKITGLCSKLLCCIAYENDMYTDLRVGMPRIGQKVGSPCCKNCKVIDVDVLSQLVKVDEEGKRTTYSVKEIRSY